MMFLIKQLLFSEVSVVAARVFYHICDKFPAVNEENRETSMKYLVARSLLCVEVCVKLVYDILLMNVAEKKMIIGRLGNNNNASHN